MFAETAKRRSPAEAFTKTETRRKRPKISGGDIEEATPDPIPNSEVKLFGADGTAREAVWESRTLPGLLLRARTPPNIRSGVMALPFLSIATARMGGSGIRFRRLTR